MTQNLSAEEKYNTVRAIHLASVAALGGFLFGYDTAVINGAVGAMREEFGIGPLFALLSFLFVLKFVRETRGRQLEDAD